MANYITEENSDSLLAAGMTNFLEQAQSNATLLGLTTAELAVLSTSFDTFKDSFDAATTAKALQKSATSQKNSAKQSSKKLIAQYAQEWRSNPAIPDSVLDKLNVPNHQTQGTRTAPTQPLNLRLTIGSTGSNTLAWDRNGNTQGTIFNIESATSANGPWTTYDMTTKAKLTFNWPIGETVWFRVNAKRNGQTSANSQVITLWATGSAESLALAA
jgi:hypothetical protein